jgi:hypothetical protein
VSQLYTAHLGHASIPAPATPTVFTVPAGHRYAVLDMSCYVTTSPCAFLVLRSGAVWVQWAMSAAPASTTTQWRGLCVLDAGDSLLVSVSAGGGIFAFNGWDLLTP